MSSAADLLAFALIVLGLFGLWQGRAVVPPLLRAAGRWLRNACAAAPCLLRNVFVGREPPPRPRHAWQKPRVRITWVARSVLYLSLVAAVIWQWHGRASVALYAADLEVEASAPRHVPANEPLPLRVVASPLGGGTVQTEVSWRAHDEDGALLASGNAACLGASTVPLPHANRVHAVDIVVRGPKGDCSLRLDRTEPLLGGEVGDLDRAHTRCAARAHALMKTAERQQYCAAMVARLALVLVGLWIVGEVGAWLARRALRSAATTLRQAGGASLIVLPIAAWLWIVAGSPHGGFHRTRLEDNPFVHFLQVARGGIEGDCWYFSWSWWLPLDVDTSWRGNY